nr:hypothetical protein [Tanacetum cinerariifolium]
MRDAQQTNVQTTQVIEDTYVIITPVNPKGQQHSSSVSSGFISNILNPSLDSGINSIFNLNTESTSLVDVSVTTIVEPPLLFVTTLSQPPTPLITHLQQTPIHIPATVPSSSLQDLPNFGSLFGFEHKLKTLEIDFSEFKQTNQFAEAVSLILGIVDSYLANKMNEAIKTAVQLQSDRLRDEAQAENEDFINKLDDNIKKIIKDQVKEQVKEHVSKIFLKIKKTVNEQLEGEILTRSSNKSKTSHAVAANLYELELKKILIDKMKSNKSIHRYDKQKNLYKSLDEAYESEKLILDIYGETITLKRRQDDEDKNEEPSAGSNRGSKRRRARKQPESTSAPKEKTYKTTGKSNDGYKSHHKSAGESAQVEKPMYIAKDLEEPANQEFKIGVIPFAHFINNDLEYLSGDVSSRKYATLVTKTKVIDYRHIKWIEDLVPNIMWSQVPVSYDKNDDKLYTFKEGDFNRLRIQDMLLLLVQGKLTNLTIKERLAFNNKDKKNRLMLIDELHKFSDGTLNDVWTALDDRLKGIQDCDGILKRPTMYLNLWSYKVVRHSDEVLKLKNFMKDALLKLFKLSKQERYEYVGPKVTSAQSGKDYKMAKRDYAWLMILRAKRLMESPQSFPWPPNMLYKYTSPCLREVVGWL